MSKFREYQSESITSMCLLPFFKLLGFFTNPVDYRGVGKFSKVIAKFLPSANVILTIEEHAYIEIDLRDFYWSKLIYEHFTYDPELALIINRYLKSDSIFINCGANLGYWSISVQNRLRPGHIVAIEGSSSTYKKLVRNCALNGNHFETIHAAISDKSGQNLTFKSDLEEGHVAAHITSEIEPGCETVESIAIDDIVNERFETDGGRYIFIKLDVEGGEVNALRGAKNVLKNNKVIILYEDHGHDHENKISNYIMNELRFKIFDPNDEIKEIFSVKEISDKKTDDNFGYNYVATNIDGFLESDASLG